MTNRLGCCTYDQINMSLENRVVKPLMPSSWRHRVSHFLPVVEWLPAYRRRDSGNDIIAGIIVAIMLIPQGMAYALLAGLPPQTGLYASILPVLLYSLCGTSRFLAVGPVAMVSLLVAAGVSQLAVPGSAEYIGLALALALLVGLLQLVMGVARLGFLLNLLSHPVISGFTSAAALLIGFSQLRHILGLTIPAAHRPYQTLWYNLRGLGQTNLVTLAISFAAIATLLYFSRFLRRHLRGRGVPRALREPLVKSGPLLAVIGSSLTVWGLGLHERAGVQIVGAIPAGLPGLTMPSLNLAKLSSLLPVALTIALVGFMESISIATTFARKRHHQISANQELIALGMANIGAALTGGFPVTGSLSRSVVNYTAGARTNIAAVITALCIIVTVLFLLPLFHFLPQATLAAIIIVAVVNLIDVATFDLVWHYSKADTASLLGTFFGVMIFDIETGILIGFITALVLYLWRTSHPHMVVLGRVGDTEHFRSAEYFSVTTYPQTLAVRIDQSLYFANTKYLEIHLMQTIAEHQPIKNLILVCSGVNFIDASAMETLETIIEQLRYAGLKVCLAEIKSPVLQRLKKINFIEYVGPDNIFFSTHDAIRSLGH